MVRILLVEDDVDIRESMVDLLELEGYAVDSANNGEEALAFLRSRGHRPDVILLDLMMPRMDGEQFREAQLEDAHLADIPVVMLTADGRFDDQRRQRLRLHGVMRKPIEYDSLVRTIDRICA